MAKPFPKVSMVQFLRSALSILKNPLPFHKRNFEAKGDTFQLKIGFGPPLDKLQPMKTLPSMHWRPK